MMQISDIIFSVIGIVVAFASLFAGIGYWKRGKSDGKLDTITLFEKRTKALEDRINDQDGLIDKLTKEVRSLHDAIDLRDKKFAETILMLQGQDPATKLFMERINEYMTSANGSIKTFNEEVVPVIKKLDKFLEGQKVVGTVLAQK